jgi:hypothetical protein
MNIEDAAKLLDIKDNELNHFEENDPYNNNIISGYLCRRSDHRYGALVIYKVNGREVEPQVIYCTPKLHYPFSTSDIGDRNYKWPKFKRVYVYTKLDGTNVCIYSYADADNVRYVTFKTRLTPILKESKFGNFLEMWNDVLKMYPDLRKPKDVLEGKWSLSFEMYGTRNPLLIKYDVSLDTRLLFGVEQSRHLVLIPQIFDVKPSLECLKELTSTADITKFYDELRKEAKDNNVHNEDGSVSGSEGFVLYVQTETDEYMQFKCKPEDIEAIHWVNDSIPHYSIINTTLNAVEDYSGDDITTETFFNHVIELLKEEYSQLQIDKSWERIKKDIQIGIAKILFRQKVADCSKLIDTDGDKGFIMRQLSQWFDKKDMRQVYQIMVEWGYIKEII